MFVEKLEEAIKQKAKVSFKEDYKKLEGLVVNSNLGKVLEYEEKGLETLWGIDKEQLEKDYVEKFIEKEVDSLLNEVEEEELEFRFDYEKVEDEDYPTEIPDFSIQDFDFKIEGDKKGKLEKIVDVLRGRD